MRLFKWVSWIFLKSCQVNELVLTCLHANEHVTCKELLSRIWSFYTSFSCLLIRDINSLKVVFIGNSRQGVLAHYLGYFVYSMDQRFSSCWIKHNEVTPWDFWVCTVCEPNPCWVGTWPCTSFTCISFGAFQREYCSDPVWVFNPLKKETGEWKKATAYS